MYLKQLHYDVQDVIDYHIQMSQKPWQVVDFQDSVQELVDEDPWLEVDLDRESD